MKVSKGWALAAMASVMAGTSVTAKEPQAPASGKPPSPFVQCDGMTGHVGAAEFLGRLLMITATAGLSEAATRKDDPNHRLEGTEGAAACDRALASEGNGQRRAQLALARSIHLIEARQYEAAVASAREVSALAKLDGDWGGRHTFGASAAYLEAEALARLGRATEAEDAAMRSGEIAELEVIALRRAAAFAALTPRMTDAKRRYLATLVRALPSMFGTAAEARGWAGDFAGAAAASADFQELVGGFADKPITYYGDAYTATYAVFDDPALARTLAMRAGADLEKQLAGGAEASAAGSVATATELLAFVDAALLAVDGKTAAARAAFAARGKWLLVPRPAVAELARRLGGSAAGVLDPDRLRDEIFRGRLAAISDPERNGKLYAAVAQSSSDSAYGGASGAVWKVGDKPRFLVKREPKDSTKFEIVSNLDRMTDLSAGEGLLLHCALIARSRGLGGFAVQPSRTHLQVMAVRFGTPGQPGFPVNNTFGADAVITAIAPHIPQPIKR